MTGKHKENTVGGKKGRKRVEKLKEIHKKTT